MSEAVRELVKQATSALEVFSELNMERRLSGALDKAILAVERELNKSPAEQHQERLEEVLEWNR